MVSNSTDRFNGVVASKAYKVPCVVASDVDLPLTGTGTINGVPVSTGDRVLVRAQTNAVENGVYVVDTAAWTRAPDWDGNRDIERGSQIVAYDNLGNATVYIVSTPNPIVIGSTALTIDVYLTGSSAIIDPGTTESAVLRWNDGGSVWQEEERVQVTDAGQFRVLATGLTDYVQIEYSGSSAIISTQNASHSVQFNQDALFIGDLFVVTGSNLEVQGGGYMRVSDSANIDSLTIDQNFGADAVIDASAALTIQAATTVSVEAPTSIGFEVNGDNALSLQQNIVRANTDSGGFFEIRDDIGSNTRFTMTTDGLNIIASAIVGGDPDRYLFQPVSGGEGLAFMIAERNAARADIAGYGQLWVRDDTPNVLVFTDDAGTDFVLGVPTNPGGAANTLQYNDGVGGFAGSTSLEWFEAQKSLELTNTTVATNPLMRLSSDQAVALIDLSIDGLNTNGIQYRTSVNNSYLLWDVDDTVGGNGFRMRFDPTLSSGNHSLELESDDWGTIFVFQNDGDLDFGGSSAQSIFQMRLDVDQVRIANNASLFIEEKSADLANQSGFGQIWVRDDTPQTLMFTSDDGSEREVAVAIGTPVNNYLAVWTGSQGGLSVETNLRWTGTELQVRSAQSVVLFETANGSNQGRIRYNDAAGLAIESTTPRNVYLAFNLTPKLTVKNTQIDLEEPLFILEAASAAADQANYGQIWVRNDTPNTLWFTDDAGTDYQIGGAGAPTVPAGTDEQTLVYVGTTLTATSFLTHDNQNVITVTDQFAATHAWAYNSGGGGQLALTSSVSLDVVLPNGLLVDGGNAEFRRSGTIVSLDGQSGDTLRIGGNSGNFTGGVELPQGTSLVFLESGGLEPMSMRNNGTYVLMDFNAATRGLRLDNSASIYLEERAAANTDQANYGQLWVRNDTPNVLVFTDDAGTDFVLNAAAGIGGTIANNQLAVGSGADTIDGSANLTWDDQILFVQASIPILDINGTNGLAENFLRSRAANGGIGMITSHLTGGCRIVQTASGGAEEDTWIDFSRNGAVELRHNDVGMARTVAAGSGGLEVNNTVTGAGFERVLTTSDAGAATPGGADTQFQYNNAGVLAGTADLTYDGTNITAVADIILANTSPQFFIRDTNATADEGNWIVRGDADLFRIQTASDAAPTAGVNNVMSVSRTGTAIAGLNLNGGLINLDAASGQPISLQENGTTRFQIDNINDRVVINDYTLFIEERAAALADVAGYGQFWVRNDTPNTLVWTDDAGNDWELAGNNAKIIAGDPGFEGTGIDLGGTVYDSALKVSSIGGSDLAQMILHRHSTTLAPVIVGARSNSNDNTHALVTDGQILYSMIGAGWDGNDYKIAGQMRCHVDGTAASNDMPGRWEFLTTADGGTTQTLAFAIRQNNHAQIYSVGNTDSEDRVLEFLHQNGTRRAYIGHLSTSTSRFNLISEIHGANVLLGGEDAGGTLRTIVNADPDSSTEVRAQTNITMSAGGGSVPMTLDASNSQLLIPGALGVVEAAAAPADTAGQGQFWVRNDTPNTPMFTDDAGTDYVLNASGGAQISGTPVNNQVAVWTGATDIEGDAGLTYDGNVLEVNNVTSGVLRARGSTYQIRAYDNNSTGDVDDFIFMHMENDNGFFGIWDDSGGPTAYGAIAINVNTAVTTVGNVTGGVVINGSVQMPQANFNDNVEIRMGTGNDVLIDYTGSNFIINNTGAGQIQLTGAPVAVRGGENFLVYDSTNSDYVGFAHSGTNARIITFGTNDLYFEINTVVEATVQDSNSAGITSGMTTRDHAQNFRDVGFNDLAKFNDNVSDTLEAGHCGSAAFKDAATARTLTLAASGDLDFPVDGMTTVINGFTSGDYTITEGSGTTLYYLDGSTRTDTAGGCTVGPGGVANIWRESSTVYYIWGTGITP